MRNASVYQDIADAKGITINKLENLLGVSNGSIRKAIQRQSVLKSDIAEKIVSTFPDISRTWLLTGEGKMFAKPQPQSVSGEKQHTEKPGTEPGEVHEQPVGYSPQIDVQAKYIALLERQEAKSIEIGREAAREAVEKLSANFALRSDQEEDSIMIEALQIFSVRRFVLTGKHTLEDIATELNSTVDEVRQRRKNKNTPADTEKRYTLP